MGGTSIRDVFALISHWCYNKFSDRVKTFWGFKMIISLLVGHVNLGRGANPNCPTWVFFSAILMCSKLSFTSYSKNLSVFEFSLDQSLVYLVHMSYLSLFCSVPPYFLSKVSWWNPKKVYFREAIQYTASPPAYYGYEIFLRNIDFWPFKMPKYLVQLFTIRWHFII